jgi:hypothetical protein
MADQQPGLRRGTRAPSNANGFDTERLRVNEWLLGAASLVLLVSLFALHWFGVRSELAVTAAQIGGVKSSYSGWDSFTVGQYVIVLTCLVGLAAWYFQASRRAPALPVTLTVMSGPLGLLSTLLIFHRVVLSKPGPKDLISLRPGAIVGLLAAATLTAAAWRSLRDDGIREVDGPGEIETFRQRRRPVSA